jgi:hypothetical protein
MIILDKKSIKDFSSINKSLLKKIEEINRKSIIRDKTI